MSEILWLLISAWSSTEQAALFAASALPGYMEQSLATGSKLIIALLHEKAVTQDGETGGFFVLRYLHGI